MQRCLRFDSSIGWITVCRSDTGIACIDIGSDNLPLVHDAIEDELLIQCKAQLLEYLAGKRSTFTLPLDWSRMTSFQAEVLRLTNEIPFGKILRYGDITQALHKPAASRAVGGALAHNPLPILIPCHRVVAASGALTGYSAANGIATKAQLLELEGHKVVGQKLA